MANITVTASKVAVVFPKEAKIVNVEVAEDVTAGQTLYLNSSGTYGLADADAGGKQQTRVMALEDALSGWILSALQQGHVAGPVVSDLDYDAIVYQSDTPGALADAAGTLEVPCGLIVPMSDPDKTKVLYFNPRWREDFS
jgi:hypothetical protein